MKTKHKPLEIFNNAINKVKKDLKAMEVEDMTTIDIKNQFHKYDMIISDMAADIKANKESISNIYAYYGVKIE